MFRQIATILLLVAFSAQTFNRAVIIVGYYVNTASFVDKCENKAAPELDCEGKCQVTKKIKDEDKKEQQNPERKVSNHNEVISSKSFYCSLLSEIPTIADPYFISYKFFLPKDLQSEIFHPPGKLG